MCPRSWHPIAFTVLVTLLQMITETFVNALLFYFITKIEATDIKKLGDCGTKK